LTPFAPFSSCRGQNSTYCLQTKAQLNSCRRPRRHWGRRGEGGGGTPLKTERQTPFMKSHCYLILVHVLFCIVCSQQCSRSYTPPDILERTQDLHGNSHSAVRFTAKYKKNSCDGALLLLQATNNVGIGPKTFMRTPQRDDEFSRFWGVRSAAITLFG
jgi:hypothetical protein